MKKKILTYCRGRCIYTASRARRICMLRDNWPVIDWREPIGLQERLEGRSSHNGVISVMSRDSLKGNTIHLMAFHIPSAVLNHERVFYSWDCSIFQYQTMCKSSVELGLVYKTSTNTFEKLRCCPGKTKLHPLFTLTNLNA